MSQFRPKTEEIPIVAGIMNHHGFKGAGKNYEKIQAIKDCRYHFHWGLKEAKEAVEWVAEHVPQAVRYGPIEIDLQDNLPEDYDVEIVDGLRDRATQYIVTAKDILENELGVETASDYAVVELAKLIFEISRTPTPWG